MATKKFGELSGVRLRRREDGTEHGECECRRAGRGELDKYDVVNCGDVIFEIDLANKTINRCNVKYIYKDYHGVMVFYYCDIKHNRDFKPDYDTFYGRNIPPNMKRTSCMYNKSVSGLICTNMEEAVKRLNKINNGKYLGALKEGDKLYVVDKEHDVVHEETVQEISYNNRWYNDNEHFNILTEHYRFDCCNSEYEENASKFSDKSFYVSGEDYPDDKKYSIHMDKTVADRALREYLNAKTKSEKKKAEAPEIPVGTPIRHTGNKNQKLHYGDVVAYVRKDWGGHTDISFGVVCGDSEKKIKIFDGEEVGKKKRSWSDEKHDGIHMLEPANILLVRLGKQ